MISLNIRIGGKNYNGDLSSGCSIAIDLNFDGPQPRHFGVEPANRRPLKLGDFIGNTAIGSGCNVDVMQLIPHCNGTHTETVGHIVDDSVEVARAAANSLFAASLISVEPESAVDSGETYRPDFDAGDRVITKSAIEKATAGHNKNEFQSLIIRSLPNERDKCSRNYGEKDLPAFLTTEAVGLMNELGIEHLIVDLPSIDRMHDEGLLTNHHLFWNVAERTHVLAEGAAVEKTITEMAFVPNRLKDGPYLLNLQIAPFCSDAAPSRPILFPLIET